MTLLKRTLRFDARGNYFRLPKPKEKSEIRVFVLEDDLFNREILELHLTRYFKFRSLGFPLNIDVNSEVGEATTFINERLEQGICYDLVFTDYHLSDDLTGVDFVQQVHKVYNTKQKQYIPPGIS